MPPATLSSRLKSFVSTKLRSFVYGLVVQSIVYVVALSGLVSVKIDGDVYDQVLAVLLFPVITPIIVRSLRFSIFIIISSGKAHASVNEKTLSGDVIILQKIIKRVNYILNRTRTLHRGSPRHLVKIVIPEPRGSENCSRAHGVYPKIGSEFPRKHFCQVIKAFLAQVVAEMLDGIFPDPRVKKINDKPPACLGGKRLERKKGALKLWPCRFPEIRE